MEHFDIRVLCAQTRKTFMGVMNGPQPDDRIYLGFFFSKRDDLFFFLNVNKLL